MQAHVAVRRKPVASHPRIPTAAVADDVVWSLVTQWAPWVVRCMAVSADWSHRHFGCYSANRFRAISAARREQRGRGAGSRGATSGTEDRRSWFVALLRIQVRQDSPQRILRISARVW